MRETITFTLSSTLLLPVQPMRPRARALVSSAPVASSSSATFSVAYYGGSTNDEQLFSNSRPIRPCDSCSRGTCGGCGATSDCTNTDTTGSGFSYHELFQTR